MKYIKQRGLSGTVFTDKRVYFALFYGKRNIIQGFLAWENLSDMLKFYIVFHTLTFLVYFIS